MSKIDEAEKALRYIIPIIERHKFRWCISGGFACYLYGVKRAIPDIDIDIEASQSDPNFREFIAEIKKHTKLSFQRWIDRNYDNWVVDVVIGRQLLSIISSQDMLLFNKQTIKYELFYSQGIPNPNMIEFHGLSLPILPLEQVLKLKNSLAYKKATDKRDVEELSKLLS